MTEIYMPSPPLVVGNSPAHPCGLPPREMSSPPPQQSPTTSSTSDPGLSLMVMVASCMPFQLLVVESLPVLPCGRPPCMVIPSLRQQWLTGLSTLFQITAYIPFL